MVIEGNSKNFVEVVTNRSKLVHWRTVNFVVEVRLLHARFDHLEFVKLSCTCLSKMDFVKLFSKVILEKGIGPLGRIVLA